MCRYHKSFLDTAGEIRWWEEVVLSGNKTDSDALIASQEMGTKEQAPKVTSITGTVSVSIPRHLTALSMGLDDSLHETG